MLLRLPLEITLSIFKELDFEDKLSLKTTCSKLNGLITKAVLYEELDLLDTQHELNRYRDRNKAGTLIVQKLIKDKFDGSVVKVLHFDIDELSDNMIGRLSNLFPNVTQVRSLKEVDYGSLDQIGQLKRKRGKTKLLKRWRDTIEKIVSATDWIGLIDDLLVSKYPRLTDLRLFGVSDLLKQCVGKSPYSFFTNAPALTNLEIFGANINLEIMEAVHAGFPLLCSLKLFGCELEMEKGENLPSVIVPANTVTYLVLFRTAGFNSNCGASDYIIKKYPNLKQIIYGIDPDKEVSAKTRDGLVDAPSRPSVSEENTLTSSKAAETRFFSHLPKSLLTLNLDMKNTENAIAALAASNSNVKIIDMLDHNTSSNRVWKDTDMLDHFKTLTSLQTLKIPLHSSLQTSTSEFISLNVTKLVISFNGDTFYMDWILSMFPNLEELHINPPRWPGIFVNTCKLKGQKDSSNGDKDEDMKEIETRKVYPKLRFLNIMKCFVHPEFFDFIKLAAPNLDELNLSLIRLSMLNTKTCKYNLSNWSLNKCSILFEDFRYREHYVYIFITIQNVSKYLVFDTSDKSIQSVGPYHDLHLPRTWLELTVDPLQDLNICGFPIVKIGDRIVIDL